MMKKTLINLISSNTLLFVSYIFIFPLKSSVSLLDWYLYYHYIYLCFYGSNSRISANISVIFQKQPPVGVL